MPIESPRPGSRALALIPPLAAGVIGWAVHPPTSRLVSAPHCPGLFEWVGVTVARTHPHLHLGLWLESVDRGLFAAGIAVFAVLARTVTREWASAIAAALALAVLPLIEPRLAALPTAGLLVAAVAFLTLRAFARHPTGRGGSLLIATFAITAAAAPPLAPPLAVIAGVIVWRLWGTTGVRSGRAAAAAAPLRRGTIALAAGAGVLAASAAVIARLPVLGGAGTVSLWTCWWAPHTRNFSMVLALAGVVIFSAGPYAAAVALYGLFTRRRSSASSDRRFGAALAAAPVAATLLAGADASRVLFPSLVAFWMLTAAGLSDVLAACRPRLSGRLAAALLTTLLPLLSWSRRAEALETWPHAIGHAGWSLADLERVRVGLPAGSALVVEDALADLLLRASAARSSSGTPPPDMLPLTTDALESRLASGQAMSRVFALPAAQRVVQNLGFSLSSRGLPAGIAAVQRGGSCRVLGTSWRDLPALTAPGVRALALDARDPSERGPIVLYVTFARAPAIHPRDWPPAAMRGFNYTIYDSTAPGRDAFAHDAAADGLTAEGFVPAAGWTVRFELWRVPSAPEQLAVELSDTPTRATGHVIPPENTTHLLMCPAYPYDVQPF